MRDGDTDADLFNMIKAHIRPESGRLSHQQRAELIEMFTAPKTWTEPRLLKAEFKKRSRTRTVPQGLRVLIVLILIALFASEIVFLNVLQFQNRGLAWMGGTSLLLATFVGIAYLAWNIWRDPPVLGDSINLGIWLWGGVMMLIAFNFGAVVLIVSECINLERMIPIQSGRPPPPLFAVGACNRDQVPIVRFFLAAKEFGTLIAVTLGFASIAWVNFFKK
ncbi:MAG: hypothetical protein AAGH68_01055 [Pseudomonadota bacterium]